MFLKILTIIGIVLLAILALVVLYILFACVCSLFVSPKKDYPKDSKFYRFLMNSLTWLVLGIVRVKIHVTGKENLPDGRFLLVSNHISNYDPLITWMALKKQNLAFVSKPSNFKIPFFGRIVKRCCFLAIDRENAKNAITTINKASQLIIDNQASVGIYPEGTRSKTKELLPFHNFVFRCAQKAQVPIVVCTVRETDTIHKRTPWRSTHVYLDILGTIPTEEVLEKRTSELGEKIYEQMKEFLNSKESGK